MLIYNAWISYLDSKFLYNIGCCSYY